MKNVISEWKSWCPISLQRGLATLNLLLWNIIRTSCFNNSNSSHKCIIFSQKLLFWFAKSLVPPLEKNVFSINLLFKRIKDQNTVLCLLLTIIALTSLSPWSVYPTLPIHLHTLDPKPLGLCWFCWPRTQPSLPPMPEQRTMFSPLVQAYITISIEVAPMLQGGINSSKTLSIHLDNLIKAQWA